MPWPQANWERKKKGNRPATLYKFTAKIAWCTLHNILNATSQLSSANHHAGSNIESGNVAEAKRAPIVSKFFECISLRTGAIIIASIRIAGIIDIIVDRIISLVLVGQYSANLIAIGLALFELPFYLCGIYGALKNRLSFVKTFAIFCWFTTVVNPAFASTAMSVMLYGTANFMRFAIIIASGLASLALSIYFSICIWSYYMELRDSPERYGLYTKFEATPVSADANLNLTDADLKA
ncbi:hypothetical protein BC829DRAFT_441688 [Chytridium lagenaria]|nr:hypothetical protein BC829DRAFT_441688 [Chytridium lagenaria]